MWWWGRERKPTAASNTFWHICTVDEFNLGKLHLGAILHPAQLVQPSMNLQIMCSWGAIDGSALRRQQDCQFEMYTCIERNAVIFVRRNANPAINIFNNHVHLPLLFTGLFVNVWKERKSRSVFYFQHRFIKFAASREEKQIYLLDISFLWALKS